jgi:uncharacterized membrane protein SpoIIM required for sporulation
MKESKFIEQNKENWLEFENNLKDKKNVASKLSSLFIQIADDLSYACTFYKHRSVKLYLNGVAQILFNELYKNRAGTFKSFLNFWKKDLPLQMHEARNEVRISFSIFLIAFLIGIVSSIYDKDFARIILGEDYVKMTLENIKNNDPLAVYKKAHEMPMFMTITVNNLIVSIYTFVLGVVFCAGSIVSLISNAVMVGGFQYFFIERGLFRESFLTVWQHGTLEISCIIIAGAAGITLGKGLIFAGTYSRIDSFKRSAKRGLIMFTGIAPIIVMAAFIEGFVTRHTNVGDSFRISVIVFSLLFMLLYFGLYPWLISKKYSLQESSSESIDIADNSSFISNKILTSEEIFGQILKFTKKNILWLIIIVFIISLSHSIITVIHEFRAESFYTYNGRLAPKTFFSVNNNFWQIITGIISLSVLQIIVVLQIYKLSFQNPETINFRKLVKLSINAVFVSLIIIMPFSFGFIWGLFASVLISPLLFLNVFYSYSNKTSFFNSAYELNFLLYLSWKKIYWNSLKILALVAAMYLMLNSGFLYNYIKTICLYFNYNKEVMYLIQMFLITFISVSLLAVFFFLQISSVAFITFSLKETTSAENLKSRIAMLGERTILFGFEKE